MRITGSNNQLISYQRTNIKSDVKQKPEYCSSTQDKSALEPKLNESADIWGELSKKYNIRNASFSEVCDISSKLYEAGQISLKNLGDLTFDINRAIQSITGKPGNGYLTPANQDGRRDWIAEYEAKSTREFKNGNVREYTQDQELVKVLKRLL